MVVIADSFVNLKVVGVYGRVAIGNVVGVVSMVVLVARIQHVYSRHVLWKYGQIP